MKGFKAMRLHSFRVENFKSIIDTGECKISDTDNIVILAGQNESGKTSVLEALDLFANGPSADYEKLQKRINTNSTVVTCCFTIEDIDRQQLEAEFADYEPIIKFLKKKTEAAFLRSIVNGEDRGVQVDEAFLKGFPEVNPIKADEEITVDQEPIQEQEEEEEETAGPETAEDAEEEEPDVEEEIIAEATPILLRDMVANSLIRKLPALSLYSSFRDLLPSEKQISELKDSNAIRDFEAVFDANIEELASIRDRRQRKIKREEIQKNATDDFNQSWNQTISSMQDNKKYSFSIDIDDSEPKKVTFMIQGEDGIPLYLEQKSMGFRWFSAFHLRLRTLRKQVDSTHDINISKRIIILIDEPGQNLHDVAQRDVKRILNETAEKQIQIIYSTHNPNLIGDINTNEIEYTRIRLVVNEKDIGTRVYNIPQFIARKEGGSIDALSPIRTAMGLNSVGSIFDSNKFNVVVEGITDNYYLSAFKILFKYDDRLQFIPACGVNNVKSLVALLIGWGMDYKAVFDGDPRQGRKAYNDLKNNYFESDDVLAHEHILKIKDCHGIEDIFSKTDFKKYIYTRDLDEADKQKSNSDLVKESGKELVARQFLEIVKNDPSSIKLNDVSKKKIEAVFQWLYEKFNLK